MASIVDDRTSRSRRLELTLYGTVVALALLYLTWGACSTSRAFDPAGKHAGTFRLYPGWIGPFKNDLSDIQWRQYRSSLPSLAFALALYTAASKALDKCPSDATACHFSPVQNSLRIVVSILFLFLLHGAYAVHVVAALCCHYFITTAAAGHAYVGPVAIWGFPAAVWFTGRLADGLPWRTIAPALAFLDSYGGAVRWHIGFNLLLLRMVSWGLDLHWTRLWQKGLHTPSDLNAPMHAYKDAPRSYSALAPRERQRVHHAASWYGAPLYALYCLYPPLYLTGPTITFNDFVCQLRRPRRVTVEELVSFGARIGVALLLLEALTHTLYVNAITRFHAWDRVPAASGAVLFTGGTMAALAFYKLIFLWLKFLVIWRVARFYALVDGVDPPENMLRCVCNNYDISGFWRSWHASFNKWLIRYMYIPLGGQKWRLLNVWPIFTFVALWHDLEWHLLRWAWLMALFIAPEMLCKAIIRRPQWAVHWNKAWFLHLCAACSAFYIAVMMAVNLVGYGFGQQAVADTFQRLSESWPVGAFLLISFFCATNLMFEIRQREKQRPLVALD